jgi:hypothetical protein
MIRSVARTATTTPTWTKSAISSAQPNASSYSASELRKGRVQWLVRAANIRPVSVRVCRLARCRASASAIAP